MAAGRAAALALSDAGCTSVYAPHLAGIRKPAYFRTLASQKDARWLFAYHDSNAFSPSSACADDPCNLIGELPAGRTFDECRLPKCIRQGRVASHPIPDPVLLRRLS